MPKTSAQPSKSHLIVPLLFAAAAMLALGVFSSPSLAQPGTPNYKYPVLQEGDFLLYIDVLKAIEENKDPSPLIESSNITEEHFQALLMKISLNTAARTTNEVASLETELGKSVLFTPEEESLYKRYENELVTRLDTLLKLIGE
jgi:hypothetical protein